MDTVQGQAGCPNTFLMRMGTATWRMHEACYCSSQQSVGKCDQRLLKQYTSLSCPLLLFGCLTRVVSVGKAAKGSLAMLASSLARGASRPASISSAMLHTAMSCTYSGTESPTGFDSNPYLWTAVQRGPWQCWHPLWRGEQVGLPASPPPCCTQRCHGQARLLPSLHAAVLIALSESAAHSPANSLRLVRHWATAAKLGSAL